MKSHILQCFLLSFPVATVGIGSSQKELGRDRSRGLMGGRRWEGAVAGLSFAPPAPGAFDGSTIMGLTGCSSRRPGRIHSSMCQVTSSVSALTFTGWHVDNQCAQWRLERGKAATEPGSV